MVMLLTRMAPLATSKTRCTAPVPRVSIQMELLPKLAPISSASSGTVYVGNPSDRGAWATVSPPTREAELICMSSPSFLQQSHSDRSRERAAPDGCRAAILAPGDRQAITSYRAPLTLPSRSQAQPRARSATHTIGGRSVLTEAAQDGFEQWQRAKNLTGAY